MVRIIIFSLSILIAGCATQPQPAAPIQSSKIEFDLSALDADGLRGPADGKVAVSYEFAIPNSEACKNEVRAIDPTVEFHPSSPGRINAAHDQYLCIGHTHQPNFRQVLAELSALPYVQRITECHFE
ncbi:hypothetical protein [Cerasicoccus maritimus]|uniref:hypothetical protein n=1 Tax=Cerasicoccus maritimus TaxID=490089 RepID=UPI002852576F|nr:hypothetical protein [Cerasicoccus maritimus]